MYEGKNIIDPMERVQELGCENEVLRAKLDNMAKEMERACMDRDNLKKNLRDAEDHIRDMNTHIAVLQGQVDMVNLIFGGHHHA